MTHLSDDEDFRSALLNFDPCYQTWKWQQKPIQPVINLLHPTSGEYQLFELQAHHQSTLDWNHLDDGKKSGSDQVNEPKILWQLISDFWPMKAAITDEARFKMHKLALNYFNQKIWNHHRRHSLGVILEQISFTPKALISGFYWDLQQLEQLQNWLEDRHDSLKKELAKQVNSFWQASDLKGFKSWAYNHSLIAQYVVFLLNQYWHYLASSLDEDCLVWIRLDASDLDLKTQILLLAHAGKEHLYLIGKNAHPALIQWQEEMSVIKTNPSSGHRVKVGLVLPSSAYLGPQCSQEIATIIEHLDQLTCSYRLLDEEQLTEQWSGIDELIILASGISVQGVRKIKGFYAAMGKVYSQGKHPLLEGLTLNWPEDFKPV